jgi:hypothetical protein
MTSNSQKCILDIHVILPLWASSLHHEVAETSKCTKLSLKIINASSLFLVVVTQGLLIH